MSKDISRDDLNDQLTRHMQHIAACTLPSEKYGRLLLASSPESRYPYVYPRDTSSAAQLFRRLAESKAGYDAADDAFALLKSMAHFMKDAVSDGGNWGQRYSLEGEDKSIYKQEDNVAHAIAIMCNYLIAATRLERDIDDLGEFLHVIDRGLEHAVHDLYQPELNLFESTTAIHESAMEEGFTCWVNFTFLYAFSLAHQVAHTIDERNIIRQEHLAFRKQFLYTISELFIWSERYVRRIEPGGRIDLRPDFTLLSPFYYGFHHYRDAIGRSVTFLDKQLWDPELGMIMRYLPFNRDFATHVHAGNGPWLQYTAILAQYYYWTGIYQRADELLDRIESYMTEDGRIPEHLSTCDRFDSFMETEWRTGIDFAKEFDKRILLDDVHFDKILEEANNMDRSYRHTGEKCIRRDSGKSEGGYIQFAAPLMWSHVEYCRALLVRAGDWWKMASS